jgi:hypothetical protein
VAIRTRPSTIPVETLGLSGTLADIHLMDGKKEFPVKSHASAPVRSEKGRQLNPKKGNAFDVLSSIYLCSKYPAGLKKFHHKLEPGFWKYK